MPTQTINIGSGVGRKDGESLFSGGQKINANFVYLDGLIAALVTGVSSVAGKTGAVTLTKSDVGLGSVDNTADTAKPISDAMQVALNAKAALNSPNLTGTPTTPTAVTTTNDTQIASTAFVKAAITAAGVGSGTGTAGTANPLANGAVAVGTSTSWAHEDHVHPTDTTRAPLNSPNLTGTPTTPTAAEATNTTQIASTAFVANAITAAISALVNSAPGTLDTLGEIAAQLAADESTAAALATTVAGKLTKTNNLSDLTNVATARTNLGLGTLATASTVTASQISDATVMGRTVITGTQAQARTALALTPGTDVQAYSANLNSWAGVAPSQYLPLTGGNVSGSLGVGGTNTGLGPLEVTGGNGVVRTASGSCGWYIAFGASVVTSLSAGAGTTYLDVQNACYIRDVANGYATRVTVAGGNVGIGTATPGGRLHVALGDASSWGTGWDANWASFGGASTGAGAFSIAYDDTNGGRIAVLAPGVAWKPITLGVSKFTVVNGGGASLLEVDGTSTRVISGPLTVAGNTAWHAGNLTKLSQLTNDLPASGGGVVKLTTGSASAVSNVTIDLSAYTGYRAIELVIDGCVTSSSGGIVQMYASGNGGTSYDTMAYSWSPLNSNSPLSGVGAAAMNVCGTGSGTTAAFAGSTVIQIIAPGNTSNPTVVVGRCASPTNGGYAFSGTRTNAGATNFVKLQAGAATLSLNYAIYGYA